jgi:D-glycero-alpha-D-manno-heptose-7-phosphate kinase
MTLPFVSVRKLLELNPVTASAPCRIDSGGTWDIKAMALPLSKIHPVTINIALNLRTNISLAPYEDERVKISSEGFSHEEDCHFERMPFNTAFGLFFAAIAYFGIHGLSVHIRSEFPVKSALGGSSTALVSLLKALSKLNEASGKKGLSLEEILCLGYHLEDGISGGFCGIQDQAAAVYGGVNRWTWNYSMINSFAERESLFEHDGKELSDKILVAFSGISHVSASINRSWVIDFLSGDTRSGWIEANKAVEELGVALRDRDWPGAIDRLRREMTIRREITPDALIPVTERLINQAEANGCGARFTGAGAGGSVWALGEPDNIKTLRRKWQMELDKIRGARILDCSVDASGVC